MPTDSTGTPAAAAASDGPASAAGPASDNLTRTEAGARSALLEVGGYRVDLDLTTGPDTFGATTTVEFDCRRPGAASFVDLVAPAVQEVELNGRRLDPGTVYDGARIELADLQRRNVLRIVADCAYSNSGTGMHRFVDPADGQIYVYTQFEPFDAHRAYACFDQPDLKATFEVTVRAPADWEVAANAPPEAEPERSRDGARTWHFCPTARISTYLTLVAAGPYHVTRAIHDGIPLGFWCQQSLAEHLEVPELLEITRQGLDFYRRLFDYCYPFGKLDQLFVPEMAGAMENVGAITYADYYVFRSKVTEHAREGRANTMLHEIAHMWFGDLVTMRWWDDLWLKESFATYLATLALAEATRFTGAWTTFLLDDKTWGYTQDQLPSSHPIVGDVVDTATLWGNFDGITYGKGAAVLKQLVAWVSRDPFFAGLRSYFRRFEYRNTALTDFLEVQRGSGRDLSAWSRDWLQTAGVNTLRPVVERDSDGRLARVAVGQEAPAEHPTLRQHRIAVGCYELEGERLRLARRVELDITGPRTEVPELVGTRAPELLLANDDDLTYAKLRLDPASLAGLPRLASAFPDPLSRALALTAAWDMTRDAELPATGYLDIVLAAAEREPDVGLLQTLLRRAREALVRYADPEPRLAGVARLATLALRQLRVAPPGSDHQLSWARAFGSNATGGEQVAGLRALLTGTDVPEGLVVDTDLRWHLLRRLVTLGAAGEPEVAAELARDPTAMGGRQAAAARAARPTAEGKAAAWAKFTRAELPAATESFAIDGFQAPEHIDLLAGYVTPYFDAIGSLWAARRPQPAERVTLGLYPRHVVAPETLAASDRWLAANDPPPALRRSLLEARDELARALRARVAARASAARTAPGP